MKYVRNRPRLLVGSIFLDTSELMRKWLDLQLQYFQTTTENFDFAVHITNTEPDSYFLQRAKIIPSVRDPKDVNSFAHARGLMTVLTYFRKLVDEYDFFLFVDMDAFPIRKGWLSLLENRLGKQYEIAVAYRPENLETRLHASILLAKPMALQHLWFEVNMVGVDLINNPEGDVSIGKYQNDKRSVVFPLLRSNRYNVHPLLHGIYYDCFYHNSCGTGRRFNMRGRTYWGHVADPHFDVMQTTQQLFDDSNGFINKLAGWKSEEYAKI